MRGGRVLGTSRSLIVALVVGAVVGAVVGGLGARLAMRLVAIWTEGPPFTLNGAEVGVISLDGTLSIMVTTAIVGTIAGLVYAAVRGALPSSHRSLAFAGLTPLLLGPVFYRDEEFELFEPRLLAVVLFLPFFPVLGYTLAAVVERVDPRPAKPWTKASRLVVLALVAAGTAAMLVHLVRFT